MHLQCGCVNSQLGHCGGGIHHGMTPQGRRGAAAPGARHGRTLRAVAQRLPRGLAAGRAERVRQARARARAQREAAAGGVRRAQQLRGGGRPNRVSAGVGRRAGAGAARRAVERRRVQRVHRRAERVGQQRRRPAGPGGSLAEQA